MPLSETLLAEIRQRQRRPTEWFSIDEIKRRDRDVEIAARNLETTRIAFRGTHIAVAGLVASYHVVITFRGAASA